MGLMRNQILRSVRDEVLQMRRNTQLIAAGEPLEIGSWLVLRLLLLLLLRLLLTNEMRLLRRYRLVYRRLSTRR